MKIKSADKLTNLKWLNMFDVDYIDKNGRHRLWQIASRSKAPKCIMCENPALKFDVKAWLVLVGFAEKGNIE